MLFRLKALISVVFLLSIMYSCSDDSGSTPTSAVIINGKELAIDSVSNVYIGNREAYCYFWEKGDLAHSVPALLICVSEASYLGLSEGSFRYLRNGLTSKYFFAVNRKDTIRDGNLTISKTDKVYKFSFSFESDTTKISGYSESSLYMKDLSGRMIIGGQRFEESNGAIAMYVVPDSFILSIMGSKLSYPQISLHFSTASSSEINNGIYTIGDNLNGKIYLNRDTTAIIKSGQLQITKELDGYEMEYSFIYQNKIVSGYYNNPIIFRH